MECRMDRQIEQDVRGIACGQVHTHAPGDKGNHVAEMSFIDVTASTVSRRG